MTWKYRLTNRHSTYWNLTMNLKWCRLHYLRLTCFKKCQRQLTSLQCKLSHARWSHCPTRMNALIVRTPPPRSPSKEDSHQSTIRWCTSITRRFRWRISRTPQSQCRSRRPQPQRLSPRSRVPSLKCSSVAVTPRMFKCKWFRRVPQSSRTLRPLTSIHDRRASSHRVVAKCMLFLVISRIFIMGSSRNYMTQRLRSTS